MSKSGSKEPENRQKHNPLTISKRVIFLCIALLTPATYYAVTTALSLRPPTPTAFSLDQISSHRAYDPTWETRTLSGEEQVELGDALSQSYRYHGCGGQSFVFFSDDGKYVLKFFKQRFTPPQWLDWLPPYLFERYQTKKRWKKADKLQRDFTSYKIACEELSAFTGVIYTHLNGTHDLRPLEITDGKRSTSIDLNAYDFLVQRRAELIYPALARMGAEGDLSGAKRALKGLFEMIATRCKKGIHDRDPNLSTNCGLLGDKAVKIDVGSFVLNDRVTDPGRIGQELERISAPLAQWIRIEHPELQIPFDESLAEIRETPVR